MFGRNAKKDATPAAVCPICSSPGLRELRMTDYSFGDSAIGHYEAECEECGWNSQYPDPLPCPGCSADLRRKAAIVQVATKEGLVVSQAPKQLLGDGTRSAFHGLGGDWDRVTDRCAACGKELSTEDWSR